MPRDLLDYLKDLHRIPIYEWPEEARDNILDGLRSTDEAGQDAATQVAWPVLDDEVARALLDVARGDGSPRVRAQAAIALGPELENWDLHGLDMPQTLSLSVAMIEEVEAALRRLYDNEEEPKIVRRRALEASVRAPKPWHEEAIRRSYAEDDEDWRVTAVFCMGYVSGFQEAILREVREGAGDVRLQAIHSAGTLGLDELGDELLRIASSATEPSDHRAEAIHAIAEIQPPGGWELLQELTESPDEEVSEAAEEALDEWEGSIEWGDEEEEADEEDEDEDAVDEEET